MDALDKAIKMAGGVTALAGLINQSPQTIVNWRKRGVPAERVLDIERATFSPGTEKPQVTRHELRPDLYPESVGENRARRAADSCPDNAP